MLKSLAQLAAANVDDGGGDWNHADLPPATAVALRYPDVYPSRVDEMRRNELALILGASSIFFRTFTQQEAAGVGGTVLTNTSGGAARRQGGRRDGATIAWVRGRRNGSTGLFTEKFLTTPQSPIAPP